MLRLLKPYSLQAITQTYRGIVRSQKIDVDTVCPRPMADVVRYFSHSQLLNAGMGRIVSVYHNDVSTDPEFGKANCRCHSAYTTDKKMITDRSARFYFSIHDLTLAIFTDLQNLNPNGFLGTSNQCQDSIVNAAGSQVVAYRLQQSEINLAAEPYSSLLSQITTSLTQHFLYQAWYLLMLSMCFASVYRLAAVIISIGQLFHAVSMAIYGVILRSSSFMKAYLRRRIHYVDLGTCFVSQVSTVSCFRG